MSPDDILILKFKESHPLVGYLTYSPDIDNYCVRFLMEFTNGEWIKSYILDTIEPTENEIQETFEQMYGLLFKGLKEEY